MGAGGGCGVLAVMNRGWRCCGDGGMGLPRPGAPPGAGWISFVCRLSSFMCSSSPWIDCLGTGTWGPGSPRSPWILTGTRGPGSYRAIAVYLLSVPIDSSGSGTQELSPAGNPSASLSPWFQQGHGDLNPMGRWGFCVQRLCT